MKIRIIKVLALALAMVLSLSACENRNAVSDINSVTTTPNLINAKDATITPPATLSDTSTTTTPSLNITTATKPAGKDSGLDTDKTCLLDNFHNILFGSIDTVEICMDFYLDGNNITAFYISKDNENEIKLVGNLDGFKITLVDESKNTLTGTVTSADEIGKFQGILTQSNGSKLPVVLDMSYACGGSLDNFYEIMGSNNQEVNTFVSELKDNIRTANKQAVAQAINYPIYIFIDDEVTTINSSQEFTDNYDKVMNENFVNTISNSYTKLLFNNYKGAMFGSSSNNIWIEKKEDGLIVVGINN